MKRCSSIAVILLICFLVTGCNSTQAAPDAIATQAKSYEMTLDDVRALSEKGDALTFSDLSRFAGMNASSNMESVIMIYLVDNDYRLIVDGSGKGKPVRADLEHVNSAGGSGIDIRYFDVDAFLETGSKIEVVS